MIEVAQMHPTIGYVVGTLMPDGSLPKGWNPESIIPLRPTENHIWENDEWVYVEPIPLTPEQERALLRPLPKKYLRKTLLLNGIPLSRIRNAINAIPDEIERDLATVEWDDSETYQRLHPLLIKIARTLGLSDLQMDSMWKQGLYLYDQGD